MGKWKIPGKSGKFPKFPEISGFSGCLRIFRFLPDFPDVCRMFENLRKKHDFLKNSGFFRKFLKIRQKSGKCDKNPENSQTSGKSGNFMIFLKFAGFSRNFLFSYKKCKYLGAANVYRDMFSSRRFGFLYKSDMSIITSSEI